MRAAYLALLLAAALPGCAAPKLRPSEASQIAGRTYVVVGASSGVPSRSGVSSSGPGGTMDGERRTG